MRTHRKERSTPTNRGPLHTAISGAVIVAAVSLLLVAVIFSNTLVAQRAAEDARILHSAEATLGATNLALKALGQAVLLAEDEALGVANADTKVAAIQEAYMALSDLSAASSLLDATLDSDTAISETAETSKSTGDEVLSLLNADRVEEAGLLLAGPGKQAFEALRDETAIHRNEKMEAVASTSDLISRVGNLPAFLAAFLIPGLAILSYRRIAKGQLKLAEVQLDARLASEHQLVRAKDDFVANISHELRTPLTSIFGFSEILLDQGLIDPEQSMQLLAIINSESGELHRMVEDLLAAARSEAGTLSVQQSLIDLASTINSEIPKSGMAGKNVETNFATEHAWGDRERVRHITRDLISNAQRYGGDSIRVDCEQQGDHVAIIVSDNGPGVEPRKAVRLFTRYVHDGNEPLMVGSVGLGLSVVRILAEAMGGDARYERVGDWSKFIVRLPISEQAAIDSRLPAARAGSLPPQVAAGLDRPSFHVTRPLVEENSFEAV
ncbi:MAG: HAMP domain-containing histidine kinase [Acidimicrobiia bacterium]|nr:HAMP domain-containing histidine kinase [Acidimicrobiia bacterium]MDH5421533.1 HAMP domain-containing histidine kinase [Acidimicrobiia bacterium]MDH5504792.1 HAMP domain-containing histidine kinase [Acidimicrobiia bacterium]